MFIIFCGKGGSGAGSEEILKTRDLRQDDSKSDMGLHGLISNKVSVIMNLNI